MTTLYCIGIGPGNSEYLTLKAANILKVAEVVFCPQSAYKKDSLAYSICQEHINKNAKIVNLVFPMTKDKEELAKYWQEAYEKIINEAETAKITAFITLGDPAIYSTYSYIIERLSDNPSIEVQTVPGITAFSACASALNASLVESDQKLALLPASNLAAVKNAIKDFETIILYKVKGNVEKISQFLKEKNLLENAFLISKVSTTDERIEPLNHLQPDEKGYFSTIIIKRGGN